MAPRNQRRREKGQMTMLQFTRPKQGAPAPPRRPLSRQRQLPLRPLPAPSAPPFFRKVPQKRKRPPSEGSLADEAWEMGDLLVNGENSRQVVKYGDEGIAIDDSDSRESRHSGRQTSDKGAEEVQEVDVSREQSPEQLTPKANRPLWDRGAESNSDDDFEPDSARKSATKERPSSRRKHSTSALRDDRASMTKRSTSKRQRAKESAKASDLDGISVFDPEVDPYEPPARSQRLNQQGNQGDDECDPMFVDGAKSEMSGTEDEDEDEDDETSQSPLRTNVRSRVRASRTGNAARSALNGHTERRSKPSPTKSPIRRTPIKGSVDQVEQELELESSCRRRRLTNLADSPSQKSPDSCKGLGRARNLKSIFGSDEESSDNEEVRQTPRRSRKRRTRRVSASSDEDDTEQVQLNVGTSTPDKQDQEDVAQGCDEAGCIIPASADSDEDDQSSPRRATPAPFVPSGSRVKRIALTPETSPSPPSTKKRRPLGRLKPRCESEEEVILGKLCTPGSVPKTGLCTNRAGPSKQISPSATRGPDQEKWYDERKIDHFSSSSQEFEATPNFTSQHKRSTRKKPAKFSIDSPDIPNVRREIFKDLRVEDDPDQHDLGKGVDGSTRQVRRRSLANSGNNQTRDTRGGGSLSPSDDDEVIDLIDLDDTRDAKANDGDVVVIDGNMESSDQGDVILNSSSAEGSNMPTPPEDDMADDGAPPPFNLIVLCNEGESIAQMKDRLGEDYVINKVSEAQEAGREIIGGEEIGLTTTFNRDVFSRFSKQVVGDHIGQKRKAKVVTEQALRGEYKFNYRGKDRDLRQQESRRQQQNKSNRSRGRGNGRLANIRRRLR